MRRVFVCSPLSAPTDAEVEANIQLACELSLHAMLLEDVSAFAPHAYFTNFLDDGTPEERDLGLRGGRAWLECADELWVMSKRGISKGMAQEIAFAAADGKLILFDPPCWAGVGDES